MKATIDDVLAGQPAADLVPAHAVLPILFCIGGLLLVHHERVLTGFAFVQTDTGDTRSRCRNPEV